MGLFNPYQAFKYTTVESRRKFISYYNAMNLKILQAYINAGENIAGKIHSSTSPKDKAFLRAYASSLHGQIEKIIKDYGLAAFTSDLDYEKVLMLSFLSSRNMATDEFGKALDEVINLHSRKGVEFIYRGKLYEDNKNISKRIWQATKGSAKNIQDVVAMAEAQGMSSAELSTLLEDFVNPDKRKMWGHEKLKAKLGSGYAQAWKDLEYNSLRLARTTISHIGTEAVKTKAKVNPFAKKVQWHSVHAQGRTCETCKELDTQIFKIEEVPYDHPNGLCYQTIYFEESMDDMADRLAAWVKDPSSDNELEQWWLNRNKLVREQASFVQN